MQPFLNVNLIAIPVQSGDRWSAIKEKEEVESKLA
jgi:hypothetical protein